MGSRLIKQQKAFPKPLLLKDYLLDDMSSCSSNGFKSFPRRQCCSSTVRFLIELDHNKKRKRKRRSFDRIQTAPRPPQTPGKSAALAALRSIISAVKRLPFATEISPVNKNLWRSIFLPRNLSRKILEKGSFWKRKSSSSSRKEMGRWKSFEQLMKEDSQSPDISNSYVTTATAGDGSSKSMPGRGFTASGERQSGNVVVNLDSPGPPNDAVAVAVGPLKNGDVSTDSTTSSNASITTTDAWTQNMEWSVGEDKEQFSPVSVLDCPFHDSDEVSSPYQQRPDCPDGGITRKKLMKKMNQLGCREQLEPVSLTEQFAIPSGKNIIPEIEGERREEEDDENQAEKKALILLNKMENTLVSSSGLKMKAEKLLLDFFREKITDARNVNSRGPSAESSFAKDILEEAENWAKERKPNELFLGWEVPRNRAAYVEDMEKEDEWRSFDRENDEVALELGARVLDGLMNELLVDISSKLTARVVWNLW